MYQLTNLACQIGDKQILSGITASLDKGKVTGLIGVSGSGKTSLLHAIGGFLPLSEGQITPSIQGRDVALVLQDHGLFPWKTVEANIRLARNKVGQNPALFLKIIEDLAIGDLLDRYPNQLSGGQSQRVAIARALYKEPQIMLMDEPTAFLDEINRMKLRQILKSVQAEYGMTTVYVTHQLQEALDLCDTILILRGGRLVGQFLPQDFTGSDDLLGYLWEETEDEG